MDSDLEALIKQKPHLKAPLLFFEKVRRYWREVEEHLAAQGFDILSVDSKSYPPSEAPFVVGRFSAVINLPAGVLAPLKDAMEVGDVDLTRLPLGEAPAFSLPYPEEELLPMLFLLSRPYFQKLREACRLDNRFWDEGRCPVCAARPALSSITDEPRRLMHCSYCGNVGHYTFTGCPICRTTDASKLGTLIPEEGEEGFRVVTCDACNSYVKTVEAGGFKGLSPDLADLVSLPLDIVAQEKGYIRHAPNPIGLTKMV